MTEPEKYIKNALGWLSKIGSGVITRKNIWQSDLQKLIQRTSERIRLSDIRASCSERVRSGTDLVTKRTILAKECATTWISSFKGKINTALPSVKGQMIQHKKVLIASVSALTLIAVIFAVTYKPIYAVQVDGEVIGYVQDVQQLQESLDEVIETLEAEYEREVVPGQEIEFVRVRGEKVEIAEADDLKETLLACVTLETHGFVMILDGKEVIAVSSQEEAEMVLAALKEDYISKYQGKTNVIEEVEFEEEVVIEGKDVSICSLMEPEQAVAFLINGGSEMQAYQVAKGDSLWSISKQFDVSLEELREANPSLQNDKLSIGQELKLETISPYINIISKERLTETVRIAFSEEVQRDANMWSWERRVAQRGQSGQKQVLYEVVRRNGVIIEKKAKSETIIQEPVVQIVIRGSRQDSGSLVVGTGRFLWPVQGRITSPYGPRSGGFHSGVDIAAPRNTPIRAADDGTVTVAVYSNVGYGNRLEINHGNGFSTLYAHCNSLAVRQGQTVQKGQIIAYVGSTGRSSGDHLHFEIRINGNHVNPMRYF